MFTNYTRIVPHPYVLGLECVMFIDCAIPKSASQPEVETGKVGRGGLGPPKAIHKANDNPIINPVSAP